MNELQHHGIKGQRWGVRRFQKKDGSLTPEGKERQKSNHSGSKDAKRFIESKSKMSVSQLAGGEGEAYLTLAATYAALIGIMYGAAKISEKRMRKQKERELEELNNNKDIKSFKEAPRLSKKMSPKDSVKVTNPDYPDMGSTMNCTFCTTAMALREKGYDVKAAKSADGWYTDTLFNKTFNAPEKKIKARTSDKVIKELSSQGDGAYGNITVTWKLGGAHSIFWKNENGTTNFYDGQSGTAYTSFSDKNVLLNNTYMQYTKYSRLDNCEPTEYALAVVERADKK